MVYKKNIDCRRLGNKVCFRTSRKPLNKIFANFFLRHTCVRTAAFRTLPKGQIPVVRTGIYDGVDKNISHIKVKANRIDHYGERYPPPQYLSQRQLRRIATVWPHRNIPHLLHRVFNKFRVDIRVDIAIFYIIFLYAMWYKLIWYELHQTKTLFAKNPITATIP